MVLSLMTIGGRIVLKIWYLGGIYVAGDSIVEVAGILVGISGGVGCR